MNLNVSDKQKLEALGVEAVVLFGSQAQGVANAASDYDIFVIGKNSKVFYDGVYDIVSDKIHALVDIDIVFSSDAPLELKHHVCSYGQVLYEKIPNVFANFREQTMREYADFAPLRAIFTKATLSRVSL